MPSFRYAALFPCFSLLTFHQVQWKPAANVLNFSSGGISHTPNNPSTLDEHYYIDTKLSLYLKAMVQELRYLITKPKGAKERTLWEARRAMPFHEWLRQAENLFPAVGVYTSCEFEWLGGMFTVWRCST